MWGCPTLVGPLPPHLGLPSPECGSHPPRKIREGHTRVPGGCGSGSAAGGSLNWRGGVKYEAKKRSNEEKKQQRNNKIWKRREKKKEQLGPPPGKQPPQADRAAPLSSPHPHVPPIPPPTPPQN